MRPALLFSVILFTCCQLKAQTDVNFNNWALYLKENFQSSVLAQYPELTLVTTYGGISCGLVKTENNWAIAIWGRFSLNEFRIKGGETGKDFFSFKETLSNPSANGYTGISGGNFALEGARIQWVHKTLGTKNFNITVTQPWGKVFNIRVYDKIFTEAEIEVIKRAGVGKLELLSPGQLSRSSFPGLLVRSFVQNKLAESKQSAPSTSSGGYAGNSSSSKAPSISNTAKLSGTGSTGNNKSSQVETTKTNKNNTTSGNGTGNASKSSANSSADYTKTSGYPGRKVEPDRNYTNNDLLLEQGRSINQQSKVMEQGIYNAAKKVNAIFDANIDRINREQAAKEAQEERAWLARKRRERAEQLRREREREARQKKAEANYQQNQQQRLDAFNAKGGNDNLNAKLTQWRIFAIRETNQIKDYLRRYGGQTVAYHYPVNNCQFVELINHIQQSAMPNGYKEILIGNVLNMRRQYYYTYRDNAYYSEEYKMGMDDMATHSSFLECGNYLDVVARSLDPSASDNFGDNLYMIVNDKYNLQSYEKNWRLPVGLKDTSLQFRTKLTGLGIHLPYKVMLNIVDDQVIWR